MFSEKLRQRRLAQLEASGVKLVEHSIEQVDVAIAHFESLTDRDDKGRPRGFKRTLTADEQEFIDNERLQSQLSFNYWAPRYYIIPHSDTLKQHHFKVNIAQRFILARAAEAEERDLPIIIQLLKARQIGGTTLAEGILLYSCLFQQDVSALIASSDPDKSGNMYDKKFLTPLLKHPWWLLPPGLKWVESGEKRLWCNTTDVELTLAHGNQESHIGRGDTFNKFHLTEIADWDDPAGHIEASLLKAIHPSSVTFGMMESTAKGRNDYWHRLWLQAKEGWDKRQSMVMPIFVPWYIASDIYPTAGWLKLIPVPDGWEADERTRKHAEAAREYVARSPHFQQLLGSNWQMPKEQQWFYQFEFNRALKNDDLGSFFSEMPATDMEAFQSQARSIFSPLLIDSYASDIPSPKAVFTVLGSEIDPQWVISADEWAPSTIPALHVKHQTKYKSFHWSLQPLKFHGYNETNFELNRLWIWEWPEEGNEYAVSLDGAKGLGKDRTVLEVIKKATPLSRPVQVAEFASDSISVGEILPIWLMLLKLYSVRSASKINWAQAAPEMAAGGDVVMQELIKLGWPNYYVRTATDRATTEVSGRPQIGFETNGRSRDYLVSWLIQFLRKKMVKINSPWLVDEMRNFVRKEGLTKERIEHDSGFHDDRLFAFGIGLVALHQLNIAGQETPQWRDYTAAEEMLTEFTTYSSPTTKGSAAELIDLFMEDSHTPRAPLSIRQLDETDVTMTELFTTFTGGVSLLG